MWDHVIQGSGDKLVPLKQSKHFYHRTSEAYEQAGCHGSL